MLLQSLQSRFIVGVSFIIALFLGITLFTFQQLYSDAFKQADLQLTTIRDIKANALEEHFHNMGEQVRVLADSNQVSQALRLFPQALKQLSKTTLSNYEERNLDEFYEQHFYHKYLDSSPVHANIIQAEHLPQVKPVDPVARKLQSLYLDNNPHHVGDKWRLQDAGDRSEYSRIHHNIHPWMQNFQSHMLFYDIFLIGLDGRIVYSVYKEVDFGTNLNTGPWRHSNLADLYRKLADNARDLTRPPTSIEVETGALAGQKNIHDNGIHGEIERTFYQDTSFYGPSYNAPAGFLGTRVYGHDGTLLGFLAAQFPQTLLDDILVQFQHMGTTTEAIVVSSNDFLLRSDSRFTNSDSLLFQKVDTAATRASAKGEAGIKHIVDYTGNDTLIAHKPLDIPDLNWSINAKMNTEELELTLADSRNTTLGVMFAAGLMSFFVVIMLLFSFKSRIQQVSRRAHKIALGDLSLANTHSRGHNDEFALVESSLIDIRSSLQKVVLITKDIAIGDVSQRLEKRSNADTLVDSINQLAVNANEAAQVADSVATGNLSTVVHMRSEHDLLGLALRKMINQLQESQATSEARNWVTIGITELNETVRGEQTIDQLANHVITKVCQYLNVAMGAIYLIEQDGRHSDNVIVAMKGAYAYSFDPSIQKPYALGESLVGQVAKDGEMVHLDKIPASYPAISSGLGSAPAGNVYLMPFRYNGEVIGVAEIASHKPLSNNDRRFLSSCEDIVAIAFHTAQSHKDLDDALSSSQAMTEELQAQQEELQAANELLEQQTHALEGSKREVEERNSRLQVTQSELNSRAQQLTQASKYKSEFLANMSHELRTPLNSILILSKLIADGGNDDEAVLHKNAQVIHDAGSDLLHLINEVLDLSKIEAGKMALNYKPVTITEFIHSFADLFKPQTDEQNLELFIDIDQDLPATLHTDKERLQQVLRNFLANAVKFTDQGSIHLTAQKVNPNHIDNLITTGDIHDRLISEPENFVTFNVIDSGIGVQNERRMAIFEAFQQADGSTSRKYGGTGLGLSISSQIASALDGAVALSSDTTASKHGSTFSIILPLAPSSSQLREQNEAEEKPNSKASLLPPSTMHTPASTDPSQQLPTKPSPATQQLETNISQNMPSLLAQVSNKPNLLAGKTVLIVDDDIRNIFALSALLENHGISVLIAENGQQCLTMLGEHAQQINLVLLDIMMPVMDGYEAMKAIRAEDQFATLPVIALTAKNLAEDRSQCIEAGASDYMAKPVDYEQLLSLIKVWLSQSKAGSS